MTALALLRRLWPALAAIALLTLILILVRCSDRAQDMAVTQGVETGRATQQADDLHETVNRTEKANAAAQEVRTDPVAKRDGCLRHSRTPANCD